MTLRDDRAQIDISLELLQQARLLPIEIGGGPWMDRERGALVGVRGFDLAHLGERGDEFGLGGEQEARDLTRHIVRHGGARHEPQRHREGGDTVLGPERGWSRRPRAAISASSRTGKRCAMASAASISMISGRPLARLGHGGHHVGERTGACRTYGEHRGNTLLADGWADLAGCQHNAVHLVRRDLIVRQNLVKNALIARWPLHQANGFASEIPDLLNRRMRRDNECQPHRAAEWR